MRSRTRGVVVALCLLLAACGGAGAQDSAPTTTSAKSTTSTTKAKKKPPATTTTVPDLTSALTGLPLADQWVKARPVVAVKIDNAHGRSTPQAGINEADVVYEIQVEGQVTRLLSYFQSIDAANVGPVRSARGSEVPFLDELNGALYVWHGANAILLPLVRNSTSQPRSFDDVPHLFYRDGSRRMPYNSFIHGTAQIRETAPKGFSGPWKPIFDFAQPGQKASKLAQPASFVHIRWPTPFGGGGGGEAPVTYKWDGALWRRDQAGRNHVDVHGKQVAVENVIVRFTGALHSGTVDSAGSAVPTADVVGSGEAWVFSKGTVTTGTWWKPDNLTPTQYFDQAGKRIRLTPGRTWVSMPYSKGASHFG